MGDGRQIRLTVDQAADQLSISNDAVRSRIRRGQLLSVREDGRVYVLLVSPDQSDQVSDQNADQASASDYPQLIAEMASRIESLERQLEDANTRDRENRRIIAGLVQRVPELEAADFPSESDIGDYESHEEPPQRDERTKEGRTSTEETEESQTASQRPWWKRIFGG